MSERYPEGDANPEVAAIAEAFATEMARTGFLLDFTQDSLDVVVDAILERYESGFADIATRRHIGGGLEAYVGETLARLMNGVWKGAFHSANPASNMYTSYVEFGAYRYYPSHFLGYRISNGPSEGTLKLHLEQVRPLIKRRVVHDDLNRP